MKKIFFLFVIMLATFNANSQTIYCTSDYNFTNVPLYQNNIDSITKIVYAKYLNENNVKRNLLLDLYYPKDFTTFSTRPLVMLIHGGGFSSGSRLDMKDIAIRFAESGYIVAAIDYRLTKHNCITALHRAAVYKAIQDAHKALLFLVNKKSVYKINPNAIFIGGVSAGAVTAINTVYLDQEEVSDTTLITTYGSLRPEGAPVIKVKGIFSSSGAMIANAFDVGQSVPQISFHGALDTVVPIGEAASCSDATWGSNIIHDLLASNNKCVSTYVDPAGNHGVYDGEKAFRDGLVMNFFKSIMCVDCIGANKCITSSLLQTCNNNFVNNKMQNADDFRNKAYLQNETTLKIEFDRTNTNQIEILIYDTIGKLILSRNENIEDASNYIEVNIGDILSKGIYIVKWNDKKGNYYSNKIIKN